MKKDIKCTNNSVEVCVDDGAFNWYYDQFFRPDPGMVYVHDPTPARDSPDCEDT